MGLDYDIHYKAGRENRAADSLSRRAFEEGVSTAMSTAVPSWVIDVEANYKGDAHYKKIIAELLLQPRQGSKYTFTHGLLRHKGRICVGSQGNLRESIVSQLHSSTLGGHSGALRTYKTVKQYFHLPGLKLDAEKHAKDCVVCLQNKVDSQPYAGLLQPLPVPTRVWQEVTMDFIEAAYFGRQGHSASGNRPPHQVCLFHSIDPPLHGVASSKGLPRHSLQTARVAQDHPIGQG